MIVFRADASTTIGYGHVARSLTLASAVLECGVPGTFVCRDLPGNASALIRARGFDVVQLDRTETAASVESAMADEAQALDARETLAAVENLGDVQAVVVDHYGLGAAWERALAPRARRVMAIDDLASRPHACDILLDQNYYAGLEHRYDGLVPAQCRLFLGPEYALLRREFAEAKAHMRPRDGSVRRILVAFGSDANGETVKALSALHGLDLPGITVDIVAGSANPRRVEIRRLCESLAGCRYHEDIDYMARLILEADLALGAGGATTWERCALGLPTLTIVIAPNQLETTVDSAKAGAIVYLGRSEDLAVEDIRLALRDAVSNPARNRELSRRAMSLAPAVDGAARVAEALCGGSR